MSLSSFASECWCCVCVCLIPVMSFSRCVVCCGVSVSASHIVRFWLSCIWFRYVLVFGLMSWLLMVSSSLSCRFGIGLLLSCVVWLFS